MYNVSQSIQMSVTEQIQLELVALPLTQQQRVLNFIQGLRRQLADEEHSALAKAGAELAAEIWPTDDFSDWEEDGKSNGQQ